MDRFKWCRALSTCSSISDGAFRVGFILVEHFHFDDATDLWSSQVTLAGKFGRSERMVRRYVAELVEAGFLATKRGGPGRPSRYSLAIPDRSDVSYQRDQDRTDLTYKTGQIWPVLTGQICPTNPLNEPLELTPGGETPPTPSSKSTSKRVDAMDGEFESWWSHYPRKVSKGAARRAYAAARKKASAEDLIAGRDRYADQRRHEDPKYTKHPTTWLNGECWKDSPPEAHVLHPNDRRGDGSRSYGQRPAPFSATEYAMQRIARYHQTDRALQHFDDAFDTLDIEAGDG